MNRKLCRWSRSLHGRVFLMIMKIYNCLLFDYRRRNRVVSFVIRALRNMIIAEVVHRKNIKVLHGDKKT